MIWLNDPRLWIITVMVMGSTLECLSHVGGGVYMSHTTGPHSYSKLGIKFPKCSTNAGNSQFAQIPGGNTLEFYLSLLMEQEEYNTVHIRTLTLFSMNSLLNCTYRFLFFLISVQWVHTGLWIRIRIDQVGKNGKITEKMLGKKLGENSIFNKIKKLNLDLLMVFSFELSTEGTLFFNRNKLSIR